MILEIDVIKGVEGNSLSINVKGEGVGVRIAGPKPWGGGDVLESWYVDHENLITDILEQVKAAKYRARKKRSVNDKH